MRIGLVCPMLSFVGGVQRHVLMLGEALEAHGVEIVYFSPAPADTPLLPKNHVQLGNAVVLPNLNGSWNDYSVTTQSKVELAALVKKHKIDILHFHALVVPFASWQLLEASPVINMATLLSGWEKDSPVENVIPIFELLVKNLKQKLLSTVAISKTALQSERYFADKNTQVIPSPINIQHYSRPRLRPNGLATDRCNLVFVGRLDKRKGFLQLLSAIKALSKPVRDQLLLHVIGVGPLEAEGLQYIAEFDLHDTVVMHGRLSEEEKIAFLQHGDIFVAPSLSGESFGIVLTEAMAAGAPIICGRNAGYVETMGDYPATDLILDPTKPRVFARAIKSLVTNRKRRAKLAKWCVEHVKIFDIEPVVRKHIEIYSKLIAAGN